MSVIESVASLEALISGGLPCAPPYACIAISGITQTLVHVKIRFISQLINDISNIFQILLIFINDSANSTSFCVTIICCLSCNKFLKFKRFRISSGSGFRINWFISVITPQTTYCISIFLAVLNQIIHQHCNI